MDNYATHKHPKVKAWLEKHPRFHLHFTPTSASWLNLVERFFALITQERIRRGAFTSVPDLESTIMAYLEHHNADPETLCLDRLGLSYPGKGRPCETSVRITTLGDRFSMGAPQRQRQSVEQYKIVKRA